MKRPDDLEDFTAEIGSHHIVRIEKLYGPLVACDLRVWLDTETQEWVIEREQVDFTFVEVYRIDSTYDLEREA